MLLAPSATPQSTRRPAVWAPALHREAPLQHRADRRVHWLIWQLAERSCQQASDQSKQNTKLSLVCGRQASEGCIVNTFYI